MSFVGKLVAASYKDILQIDNSNNGVTSSLKQLKTGSGDNASLQLSDRSFLVKSSTDNTSAFEVQDSGGSSKLLVDTTNGYIKANGVHVNTIYKEFGVFDYSPTQGNHQPMICNNMMFSDSGVDFATSTLGGTGTDPATSYDISAHASHSTVFTCCYWYVMDDIYIDQIRVMARCDSSENLNFHVYSYDLDTSTNYGDLSNGTLVAHIGSVMAATNTTIKTDTLAIDSAAVSSGKVILAFVENEDGTGDITAQLNIKAHITG